jgi:putative membrane protein
MRKFQLPAEVKALSALRTWYMVGILGFVFPFTFQVFRYLTPLSLLLLMLLFFVYHDRRDRKFWMAMIIIFLTGYGIEVVGVKTGRIFGEYEYGNILGIKLLEVPLIIGINWVIMVYGALAISSLVKWGRLAGSLLAALIMTASDFFIEKFAILSGMWSWQSQDPPLQNYLAWLIFSFAFCLLAYPSIAGKTRKVGIHGYLYQLIFFILIITIHQLFWP